jgi:hypothetical protein
LKKQIELLRVGNYLLRNSTQQPGHSTPSPKPRIPRKTVQTPLPKPRTKTSVLPMWSHENHDKTVDIIGHCSNEKRGKEYNNVKGFVSLEKFENYGNVFNTSSDESERVYTFLRCMFRLILLN